MLPVCASVIFLGSAPESLYQSNLNSSRVSFFNARLSVESPLPVESPLSVESPLPFFFRGSGGSVAVEPTLSESSSGGVEPLADRISNGESSRSDSLPPAFL
jgi:hypothetical protein